MPTPAFSTAPKTDAADAHQPDSSWYSAFTSTSAPIGDEPGAAASSADAHPGPDPLDTLTATDIPGPHTRPAEVPWQALLSLHRSEFDRLAHENRQLTERIGTLLQIQECEQVLRQQLQNQLEKMRLSSPTVDLDTVRREARAGVAEELKPVLMAILDALERFARKPASGPASTAITSTAVSADPLQFEDYGRLPAILTRPLDELVEDGVDPGRSRSGAQKKRPRKSPFRNRRQGRTAPHAAEPAAGPGPFTWTTVFTS